MIDKFVPTIAEAMAGIQDRATMLVAGAGPGTPPALMEGLAEPGVRDVRTVTPRGFAVRDVILGMTKETLGARTEAALIRP